MKRIILFFVLLFCCGILRAQDLYDPPSFYTTYYRLRCWDEGDRPGADSVNRNLIDIDSYLHNIFTGSAQLSAQNTFGNYDNYFTSTGNKRVWFRNYPAKELNGNEKTYSQLYNNEFVTKSQVADVDTSLLTSINEIWGSLNNVAYLNNENHFTKNNYFDSGAAVQNELNLWSSNKPVVITMFTPSNYFQFLNYIHDTILTYNGSVWNTIKPFISSALTSKGVLTVGNNDGNAVINFLPVNESYILFLKNGYDTLLNYLNGIFNTSKSFEIGGTMSAHDYKENGAVMHLSAVGTVEPTSFWVASQENGQATIELKALPVQIGSETYYFLKWDKPALNPNAKHK